MTTEELERILEAGRETETIEFKSPCSWDISVFVKDILAMANNRDGGVIIVGLEQDNNKFERKGISEEQKETYDIEKIKDQISEYADPFVDISIEFVNDYIGKTYVVIKIASFEEIPVICKKDSKDTKRGLIYCRTKNRRPESAPVPDSFHMRQIIETAVLRMLKKKKEELEYIKTTEEDLKKLEEELEGL